MKICGRCGLDKTRDSFSASQLKIPSGWCRECKSEYMRKRYEQPAVKERAREQRRNPRSLVRKQTQYHISTGFIKKPDTCPRCGSAGPIEAHHNSYNKSDSYLDVEFMCEPCHEKLEQEMRQVIIDYHTKDGDGE